MKSNAIQLLEKQIEFNYHVATSNIEGISDEEALIFPNGDANCMNWILDILFMFAMHLSKFSEEIRFGKRRCDEIVAPNIIRKNQEFLFAETKPESMKQNFNNSCFFATRQEFFIRFHY